MHSPCVKRHLAVVAVHCPLQQETAMNRKARQQAQQTTLPLNGDLHWIQLPADVREQCRALVVELLARPARCPAMGGDDDER